MSMRSGLHWELGEALVARGPGRLKRSRFYRGNAMKAAISMVAFFFYVMRCYYVIRRFWRAVVLEGAAELHKHTYSGRIKGRGSGVNGLRRSFTATH